MQHHQHTLDTLAQHVKTFVAKFDHPYEVTVSGQQAGGMDVTLTDQANPTLGVTIRLTGEFLTLSDDPRTFEVLDQQLSYFIKKGLLPQEEAGHFTVIPIQSP